MKTRNYSNDFNKHPELSLWVPTNKHQDETVNFKTKLVDFLFTFIRSSLDLCFRLIANFRFKDTRTRRSFPLRSFSFVTLSVCEASRRTLSRFPAQPGACFSGNEQVGYEKCAWKSKRPHLVRVSCRVQLEGREPASAAPFCHALYKK